MTIPYFTGAEQLTDGGVDRGGMSERSESIDAALEKNLRESIRLGDKIEEDGEAIKSKMEILAALRDAQEPELMPASRAASVGKSHRDRQTKRKLTDTIDDRDSIAAGSPGGHPSPKVMVSSKDRLKAMSAGSRAGSVPAGRESSVKAEESLDGQDQLKGKKKGSSKASALTRRGGTRS